MGAINAELNIKLAELLDSQSELLAKFNGGLTQIENKKNLAIEELTALGLSLEAALKNINVGGFDYEEVTNPLITTNAKIHSKWLNLLTAELFVCLDETTDANIWIGSNGSIASPNVAPSNPLNNFPLNLYGNQSYSHIFSGALDNDGSITHYKVDQISSTNLTVTQSEVAAGKSHQFTVSNITSDEAVTFRVRAKDNYGSYSSGIVVTVNIVLSSIGEAGSAGFGVGVAPDNLVILYGLIGMDGFRNPLSPNYGNYMHASTGSILVFIPKHYVKYSADVNAPYYGTRTDVSNFQNNGYKLPRVFINNGIEVPGIFVDKYKGGIVNNTFVSKRNLAPASTSSANNPISNCTANRKTPLNRYDGMYDAVKSRGDDFVELSVFLATMLADLADAHYQACYRNNNYTYCAWGTVAPFQPKGCNNNALKDANDATVVYTTSGYSNCGLTGGVSDAILPKTTHNGQACGVADVNGLMWEVAIGYITSTSGAHLVLKESVDIASLTSANAYDTNLYDTVTMPIALDNTQASFGNGTNLLFSGNVDRASNAYKIDSIGLPHNNNAVSVAGSERFGNDGFWRYQKNEMALLVFGVWAHSLFSGPRCRNLSNVRADSSDSVGGRAYLVPRRAV